MSCIQLSVFLVTDDSLSSSGGHLVEYLHVPWGGGGYIHDAIDGDPNTILFINLMHM